MDIKQATFRLDETDINTFREMTEKSGMNQAEMFQGLLNAFEMAKAKNQLADRGKEIDTFQTTVNTLVNMFLNSLEINQTSEERIREVLSLELNTKDNTIKDLQEQKQKLKEESAALKESLEIKTRSSKETEMMLEKLSKSADTQIEKLNQDLSGKSDTINSLQGQLQTLNEIIAEYKPYKDTNLGLEDELKELSKTIADLTAANKDMNSQLNNEIKMKEFYEKEVNDLKNSIGKINNENKMLEQQHKQEIDSLDQEYRQELKVAAQQHKQELQAIEIKIKETHEKEAHEFKLSIEKLNNENKELDQQHRKTLAALENKHKEQLETIEAKHQGITDKELNKLTKDFEDKLQLEKEKLEFAKTKNEAELESIKDKFSTLKEKYDSVLKEVEKKEEAPKGPKKKKVAEVKTTETEV